MSGCVFRPSGPPVFEMKYSASMKGKEKHSLFAATEEIRPTRRTSQPPPIYPSLPPSLIDEPLIVDVPKEVPLGPQEIQV